MILDSFSTRWVMSYLKGPLKKDEISMLMQEQKAAQNIEVKSAETMLENTSVLESYQNIDASIPQYYEADVSGQNIFSPTLGAKVKIHFYQQRKGIDIERAFQLFVSLDENQQRIAWEEAVEEDVAILTDSLILLPLMQNFTLFLKLFWKTRA